MTKIEAIVPPGRLDDVKRVLSLDWVGGLTVTELKGATGEAGGRYRGAITPADLAPLLRIELVVPSPLVPRLLHDLTRWLRTGRADDGLVHAGPVDEVVRLRTGERGEGAL